MLKTTQDDRSIKLWRMLVWGCAAAILASAALARATVAGFNWSGGDFLAAGALLGTGCLAFEAVTRRAGGHAFRAATGLSLLGALFVVWVNLAVGIIGAPGNPANLGFLAVLALGVGGAVIVRFRAGGMAQVMAIMAAMHLLLGMACAWRASAPAAVLMIVVAALSAASAALYRRAAAKA